MELPPNAKFFYYWLEQVALFSKYSNIFLLSLSGQAQLINSLL